MGNQIAQSPYTMLVTELSSIEMLVVVIITNIIQSVLVLAFRWVVFSIYAWMDVNYVGLVTCLGPSSASSPHSLVARTPK